MSLYKANKEAAKFYNDEPTKTDQSQAANTDINIIVTQFLRTGQAPQGNGGFYADLTELPEDLRGFIELGRSIEEKRAELPPALQAIPLNELLLMTKEEIGAKITPPKKQADEPPKDEK